MILDKTHSTHMASVCVFQFNPFLQIIELLHQFYLQRAILNCGGMEWIRCEEMHWCNSRKIKEASRPNFEVVSHLRSPGLRVAMIAAAKHDTYSLWLSNT